MLIAAAKLGARGRIGEWNEISLPARKAALEVAKVEPDEMCM